MQADGLYRLSLKGSIRRGNAPSRDGGVLVFGAGCVRMQIIDLKNEPRVLNL